MEIKFIKDDVIDLYDSDFLGTRPYVDTLKQIIEKAETPFTVGLFGSWGSGKSSIVRTIENFYNNNAKSHIKVFVYDAWKYSKDSFRRTFLLQFNKFFGINNQNESENFYCDTNEEVKHKLAIRKDWFLTILIFIVSMILLSVITYYFNKPTELMPFIYNAYISAIGALVSNFFICYKKSITTPKLFAEEQFEQVLKESIKKVSGANDSFFKKLSKNIVGKYTNKLIIVFDNIDRCHEELVFELLLTMKNFFDQEKALFIVPVDETELIKHIEKTGFDANEFMRKLFNTTLLIKKFSEADLFEFAKSLNDNNNLGLSDEVVSLIAQEFSNNPRKIIQAINILQTEILLAKSLEEKNIPEGIITKNLPFLTKMLLIREEWPLLYEKIKVNPYLLDKVNLETINNSDGTFFKEEIYGLTKDQMIFFTKTRHIKTDNIEAFFINKDVFIGLPDEINKHVLSQDWLSIKEHLKHGSITFEKLVKFIDLKFDTDVMKRSLIKPSGFNIFSLIFKISNDKEFKEEFYKLFYGDSQELGHIRSMLNSKNISDLLIDFTPSLLMDFVITNIDANRILIDQIIDKINSKKEENQNLLKCFIFSLKERLDLLRKVKKSFSDSLINNPSLYEEYRSVFLDEKVIEVLVESFLIEDFIKNLAIDSQVQINIEKVEIINKFMSFLTIDIEVFQSYFMKILDFLEVLDIKNLYFWLKNLNGLLQIIPIDEIVEDSSEEVYSDEIKQRYVDGIEKASRFLLDVYKGNFTDHNILSTIDLLINMIYQLFLSKLEENQKALSYLNAFFEFDGNEVIYLKVNNIYKELIKRHSVFSWSFTQLLIDKYKRIEKWEIKEEIAQTINLQLSKSTSEKGFNPNQIDHILHEYIKSYPQKPGITKSWFNLILKNEVIKDRFNFVINNLSIAEKIDILEIVQAIDLESFQKIVREMIYGADKTNLKYRFDKLGEIKTDADLIEICINEKLSNLTSENDGEYFAYFIKTISNRIFNDYGIIIAIVNKIKPYLSDDSISKEQRIFALEVIENINVLKRKEKSLVKELIRNLNTSDFDQEELEILDRLKKKLGITEKVTKKQNEPTE